MYRWALTVVLVALLPASVGAQEEAAAPPVESGASGVAVELPEARPETTPDAVEIPVREGATAPSPYPPTLEGKLAMGHARYTASDYAGALEAYEAAKGMDAARPEVYYFIGCAKSRIDEGYDEAVASMRTAATIAGVENEPWHLRALYAIAVLQERRGDWKAAKKAWNEFVGYAQPRASAAKLVGYAEERLSALDSWEKLEQEYASVREIISKGGS